MFSVSAVSEVFDVTTVYEVFAVSAVSEISAVYAVLIDIPSQFHSLCNSFPH
jgi:hypothetical protein